MRKLRLLIVVTFLLASAAQAATYSVTSNADSGPGTLRQAILDANASGQPATINFAIATGAQTITLLSSLPPTLVPVLIDGTTQPGYAGTPLVTLYARSACCPTLFIGDHILRVSAGGTVQGLGFKGEVYNDLRPDYGVIVDTTAATIRASKFEVLSTSIRLATGSNGSTVETNLVIIPGSTQLRWGVRVESPSNVIRQNRFEGGGYGVWATSSGNQIKGNVAFRTSIQVSGDDNVIGGAGSDGNTVQLWCGCGQLGACPGPAVGVGGNGNIISGNQITTPTAAASDTTGLVVTGNNNQIGLPGAGNVVSRHGGAPPGTDAVIVSGTNNSVVANTISEARGGECAARVSIGLYVTGAGTVVGGTTAQSRNYIYGSNGPGLKLGEGVTVQGNSIGVDASNVVVQNTVGIVITGANNTVGGTAPGAGNIIAGHSRYWELYVGPAATNTTIQANLIGTINGTTQVGSGLVWVQGNTTAVGGIAGGAGNVITGEVRIDDGDSNPVRGNRHCGPITLINGGNRNQPAPVLTGATSGSPGSVSGTLSAAPNSTYAIDIYSGCNYVGAFNVTTNASGTASFTGSVGPLHPDTAVTATATSSLNDTSPKSNSVNAVAGGSGEFQFAQASHLVRTTDGVVTLTIQRTGDTSGTSTVNYTTHSGTARGGSDFAVASGSVTFNPGETSKTIQIVILDDRIPESREHFTVQLSVSGGVLGTNHTATVTILDDDPFTANTERDELFSTVILDFNNDGKSDTFWRNELTGQHLIWYMNGTTVAGGSAYITVAPSFRPAAFADFNNDGKLDIAWYDSTAGITDIWLMDGTTRIGGRTYTTMAHPWELVGVADYDADNDPDFLWRNGDTGENLIWYLNGLNHVRTNGYGIMNPPWWLHAFEDLNNDGYADTVWQDHAGNIHIRLTREEAIIAMYNYSGFGGGWFAVGTADFNGDGTGDILLRNHVDGRNLIWYLINGQVVSGSAYFTVDSNFRVELIGDFNGDYKADIVWRHHSGAPIDFWLMNGSTLLASGAYYSFGPNWTGIAPR
jgi:hypothetical protein